LEAPVAAQVAGTEKRVHYRLSGPSRTELVSYGLIIAPFVGLAVAVYLVAGGSVWVLLFIILGLVLPGVIASLRGLLGRPQVTLTREAVRIPQVLRRTTVIPVGAVAGVGLVFSRELGDSNMPGSWRLVIFRADAHPEVVLWGYALESRRWRENDARLRARYLLTPVSPGGVFDPGRFDPVTETDTGKLAATRFGRAAADLYERVLARQNPDGPLARMQLQKHVPAESRWPPKHVIAFWSPDGVIGYADRLAGGLGWD
jgi:hypothetical protein